MRLVLASRKKCLKGCRNHYEMLSLTSLAEPAGTFTMLHQARTFDILALTFVFTCLVGDFAAAAVCKLTPSGGNDRSQIINALNKCGQDGTIRFPAGNTFLLKSPISDDDYNKLSNAKIIIEGENFCIVDVGLHR